MKKAAVVLDTWKLPTFKRYLDENGFKYKKYKGPTKGCVILKVETKTIAELQPVIEAANSEAAASGQGDSNGRKTKNLLN